MPHNAISTVDEICIPHAWYSIESNINDKLYIYTLNDLNNTYNRNSKVIVIPAGNYTGDLLKTTLQGLMTAAFVSIGQFEVLYEPTTFQPLN